MGGAFHEVEGGSLEDWLGPQNRTPKGGQSSRIIDNPNSSRRKPLALPRRELRKFDFLAGIKFHGASRRGDPAYFSTSCAGATAKAR